MSDNTERDELAGIIKREYVRAVDRKRIGDVYTAPADAILAAGYRKPRTITTVEELDALPVGSVILDSIGLSLHKNEFTGWRASNGAKDITSEMLHNEALPATVLHEPAEASL